MILDNLRMIPLLALATLALAGCAVAEPTGYPYDGAPAYGAYGAWPGYGYAPYAYPAPAYGSLGFVYGDGWRHHHWRDRHRDWHGEGRRWHDGDGRGWHGGEHHR
jgi:hypothetical protein